MSKPYMIYDPESDRPTDGLLQCADVLSFLAQTLPQIRPDYLSPDAFGGLGAILSLTESAIRSMSEVVVELKPALKKAG